MAFRVLARVSVFHSIGVFAYRFRWAILWSGAVSDLERFFAPGLSGQLKGGGFDGANSEAERGAGLDVGEFGLAGDVDCGLCRRRYPRPQRRVPERPGECARDVRELDDVRQVISYADAKDSLYLGDGKKSYAVVTSEVSVDATRIVDEVRVRSSDKLETYVTGAPAVYQDLEEASNEDVKEAEKYAFPFAVII